MAMAGGKKSGNEHEYHIGRDAAIYSGEFRKTRIETIIGTSADPLKQLSEVLTEIRQSLAEISDPDVPPDVGGKASQAATALEKDLPNLSRRTLRERVRALIDLLAPVAEIIGGVAGLEAILQHL